MERAQRTHTEEFCEVYPDDLEIIPLNQALREWEQVYNYIRPHQSLGYPTPFEYLNNLQGGTRERYLMVNLPGPTMRSTR